MRAVLRAVGGQVVQPPQLAERHAELPDQDPVQEAEGSRLSQAGGQT